MICAEFLFIDEIKCDLETGDLEYDTKMGSLELIKICSRKNDMKRIIISLYIFLATESLFAQNQTNQVLLVSSNNAIVYRLFSTRNTWCF
ncbi:hypothetical protein HYN56_10080 [Flavobacterium crocinum]|uniref:Uncharacterized protein n=1 Tax=Flavobacterium crocinum TaxID=2183896 RepID=A0A2S1YL03_9FLAO|nr:hypothetical protein HYN56_10080 [Flavobacterium crocinum]